MEERCAKRPKISRGEDDYMLGSIIEIELHNFMTFDNLICKPGPRLNLVIGPNGSGKSSLVCAIALALGGEPQLLGRATTIGAYVKRGEESGYIKISLRGNTKEEKIVITRKIDARNKSEWSYNGKVVPKRDVLEIIQRFNIQVSNLTQFLPQDRVCEFAKLTPVQLLEETEKAVGDPRLPVQHRALVEKSHQLKKIECAVEKNGDTLNQLKALNAEQEKDVERVRQREELFAKVESMKKKLPWLKYDLKKGRYMEAKEREKDAKKKLDEAARNLNELHKPIEKLKEQKSLLDAECAKIRSRLNDNGKRRLESLGKADLVAVQVQGIYKEMEDLRRQEQCRQQRILKAKEDLATAELEFQNFPAYELPKDEIDRLGTEILNLRCKIDEKRSKKSSTDKFLNEKRSTVQQWRNKLKDMENANHKLLRALQNSGTEKIFEAYRWVQEHRNEFNKPVYGPVLLEVKVSNRVHANYLEGHVPFYIWRSFITQDAADRDFLVKNFKSFDVPILNYVGDDNCRREPFQLSEEMRAFGILSRLDQVFDAPAAVKEVLISQSGLEYSYIGSRETDQKADQVQKVLGISDFWTPENHYRWTTSRYGGHVSASVDPVNPSRLLLCSLDTGEIERLRSQIEELEDKVAIAEESLKSLQTEQRCLGDKAAELEKQREKIIAEFHQRKKEWHHMKNRFDQRKRKLESIEKEDDVDTSMVKLFEQTENLNIQRFANAIEIKDLLLEAVSYQRTSAEICMASIEFEAKIRALEVNLKQHKKEAEQAAVHYENCKKEVADREKLLLEAKKHAESIAVITPELEKEFLEMPTTIEDLEAAIQETISEANSILFLNQNILEEYELRQQQIESITAKLEADKKELSRCLAEIDALKETWLPKLRNMVAQINGTFSRNFQEMAVAGEVSLDEHDMDFDQFGILIKVKFRQTGRLEVLSAHHQSGGERSVSTILYLVSLQDLTNCPFRVVDEINQGMDPINERNMFQQLVRAASQPNTPQCFLLTPKLLPDLEYSEACSILNIMNGPWIDQPSKVWSIGESWATVNGLVAESRC